MASPLCLLPVLLVLLLPLASDALTKGMPFHRLDTNDRLYTDNVLQDVSARSKIECSALCAGNDRCKRFAFLRGPSQTTCRLFCTKNHAADSWQIAEGVHSFGVVTDPGNCSSDGQCPSGYSLHCGRCLKAVGQSVTATTAQRHCQETGGQLPVVKTLPEVECLWEFISGKGVDDNLHWVAANDTAVPRTFQWSDGDLLPKDSDVWFTGNVEPDHDDPGKDCVNVWLGTLRDYPCYNSRYYSCQASTLTVC